MSDNTRAIGGAVRMAPPHWKDLNRAATDAKSGGVITAPEVREEIAPHKPAMRSDPGYKQALNELAKGEGVARLTGPAANELSKVLGKDITAGRPRLTFTPSVQSASFFPGVGYRPRPGANPNPTVSLTLQFPQSNANAEWKAKIDNVKKVITVYVKGTAPTKIVHVRQPDPVEVSFSIARPKHIDAMYTLRVVSATDPSQELYKIKFKNIRAL